MKLYPLSCPNCNGSLEIEEGIDTFYCKYCGYKIVLAGQSPETLNAKIELERIKSEQRLKELELENKKLLDERKQKQEEYDNKMGYVGGFLGIGLLVLSVLIPFLMYILK